MGRIKVVSAKNLPARLPLSTTAVVWLLMDRYRHPGWVDGVVWMIVGVFWVVALVALYYQDQVDIFTKENN